MATEAVIAPFYAPIGDKYGRRPVVLVLIAFWGIFAMGFGLSGSVITAVVMRGCRELISSRHCSNQLIPSWAACWCGSADENDGRGNVRQDQ
jgi:MFS family permease